MRAARLHHPPASADILTPLPAAADDDVVDLASSSPPPAPKGKDKKGKGKALAQDPGDEQGDLEADLTSTEELWVDKYAPRDRVRRSSVW